MDFSLRSGIYCPTRTHTFAGRTSVFEAARRRHSQPRVKRSETLGQRFPQERPQGAPLERDRHAGHAPTRSSDSALSRKFAEDARNQARITADELASSMWIEFFPAAFARYIIESAS